MKKLIFLLAGVVLVAAAVIAKTSNPSKEKNKVNAPDWKAETTKKYILNDENPNGTSEFQRLDPIRVKSRQNENIRKGFYPRGTKGAATKGMDSHSR